MDVGKQAGPEEEAGIPRVPTDINTNTHSGSNISLYFFGAASPSTQNITTEARRRPALDGWPALATPVRGRAGNHVAVIGTQNRPKERWEDV